MRFFQFFWSYSECLNFKTIGLRISSSYLVFSQSYICRISFDLWVIKQLCWMNSAKHGMKKVDMGGFQTLAYLLHAMYCQVHNKIHQFLRKPLKLPWVYLTALSIPFFSQSYILNTYGAYLLIFRSSSNCVR